MVIDISDLPERHQKALLLFVEKFKKGAKEHGDLMPGKDWTEDMLHEDLDGAFYRIFQLIDILESKR